MLRYRPAKDERKAKITIDASIGFIGILLIAGILFSILLLNSSGASEGSPASDSSAIDSQQDVPDKTLNANAAQDVKTKPKFKDMKNETAQRKAASKRLKESIEAQAVIGPGSGPCDTTYGPHYFGPCPNYATSQLPTIDPTTGAISGGIRKFVDSLPGLGPANANNLGQYIPIAVPDTTAYPGSDYYEIALVEYREQMHSNLTASKLRGYVRLSTTNVPGDQIALTNPDGSQILKPDGTQAYAVDNPHYLGPFIIANKDVPVRVKFYNLLPTGAGGDLFIPVDTTVGGAGPFTINDSTNPSLTISGNFTQNRATLHLHGGHTPWISDGTPHQWITPAGEVTSYPEGVSVHNVPDMPDPGDGSMTFFYTNNQSARLMFYHDHSFGITRLNVYAGEAAGYLINDPVEQGLVSSGVIPADQIPLVIQDKTFVPDTTTPITNMWGTFDSQLAFQDPTWDTAKWGRTGDLWFPHVYETLQNPGDIGGINAFGRWHYAPWFWPPWTVENGPVPNPYYDCGPGGACTRPWEPPQNPGTPNPSMVAEAFMDTPVVNGAAYPYLTVEPKAYRLRILNAANDRFWNLQLYQASSIVSSINVTNGGSGYTSEPVVTITNAPADTTGHGATAIATVDLDTASPTYGQVTGINLHSVGSNYTSAPIVTIAPPAAGTQATATATIYTGLTEVGMVPAVLTSGFPQKWPKDGRDGGVPDPATRGPQMIQIGTDGGFLPAPVTLPNQPVDWNWDQGTFDFGIVNTYNLFLGPAERADVIVDFSAFAGKTLILYNDAPAPVPASDPRLDYYTGNIDQTDIGGAPTTLPGYGPNTRTIMQIKVNTGTPVPFDPTPLDTAIPAAFNASQLPIIVPEASYNSVYNANFPVDPFVRIQDTSITFTPIGSTTPVTIPFKMKAIQDEMGEAFDRMYGRNGGMMGLEMPPQQGLQTTLLYNYVDPPVEIVKESMLTTPIGSLEDGTQIWMIAHNGVDSHPMHWHGYELQLINRVAWDNNVRLPDRNELGWRETLTINPLQNTIVAVRPIHLDVPFDLPNSIRLLDPTKPEGEVLKAAEAVFDPNGEPIPALTNHLVNFGWEYVWHCHILEHEEMDLMHALTLAVPPKAPTNLVATATDSSVALTWTDNSLSEINFTIQRATAAVGPWTTIETVPSTTGPTNGTGVTYTDTTVVQGTAYFYRVLATNVLGDTWDYTDPNINEGVVGFPTMTVNSTPSNMASTTAKLTVFARGADNSVMYRIWDGVSWNAWQDMGGNVASDISATSSGSEINIFARGMDNAVWTNKWNGVAWSGWQNLGGNVASDISATSSGSEINIFARGMDNAVWTNKWNGAVWSGWQSLGGAAISNISSSSDTGNITIFARGEDNGVWTRNWNGAIWSDWQGLGGVITSDPDSVSLAGETYVFARGEDNGVWTRNWNGAIWSGWQGLGGALTSDISSSSGTGNITIVARGGDNGVWTRNWNGAVWSDWQGLGGIITSDPDSVSLAGVTYVFARGEDNGVWTRNWDGAIWSGWQGLGGLTTGEPEVTSG